MSSLHVFLCPPLLLTVPVAMHAMLDGVDTCGLADHRSAAPATPPHEIYEFTDSRQAEILARCCRVWITRDCLDPECVHLAEAIIKVSRGQAPLTHWAYNIYACMPLSQWQGTHQQ